MASNNLAFLNDKDHLNQAAQQIIGALRKETLEKIKNFNQERSQSASAYQRKISLARRQSIARGDVTARKRSSVNDLANHKRSSSRNRNFMDDHPNSDEEVDATNFIQKRYGDVNSEKKTQISLQWQVFAAVATIMILPL